MEALIRSKQSCWLLRIDIDTWRSPVAQQYGIRRLPTVWLYDGKERVATDVRQVIERVRQLD